MDYIVLILTFAGVIVNATVFYLTLSKILI